MVGDSKKKKEVFQVERAGNNECKKYEEDAQIYYKSLRARLDKERAQKGTQKTKNLLEEQKKKKEREAYYAEVRKVYQSKGKNKV